MIRFTTLGMIIVIVTAISISGLYFATALDEITSELILETDTTVIDQDIKYPSDSALIVSKIITIPVGTKTGEHIHKYPMFAYVLDGEITVDYGNKGVKTFQKGDSFIEAVNYTHNGENTGDVPAKILIILMGQKT